MTPRDFCVWLDGYLEVAPLLADADYTEDIIKGLSEKLRTVEMDGESDGKLCACCESLLDDADEARMQGESNDAT